MSSVVVSIEIAAPAARVWRLAMDPQHTLEWVSIVRGVSDVDDGPLRAGFRMKQVLVLRGVPFTVAWTLVALDAPHFARWQGRGPAGSTAVIEDTLTPTPKGTVFVYANEFRAPLGPLGAVASRAVVGGIPEREARVSLQRLKGLVESQTPE